jgi:hypothetical protein
MTDQDDTVSFTREGVWRNKPFKITVEGHKELPEELNEFLATSDGGAMLLVAKKTMKKLLDDDAHYQWQRGHLQQRGTELLEELRVYRRLAQFFTDEVKGKLAEELEALKERLKKSYGALAVGSEE